MMRPQKIQLADDLTLHCYFWGEGQSGRPILCVHGLTRNARDFDWLAAALSSQRPVITVDAAGRGGSSWLADKMAYRIETYADHMKQLLDHLGYSSVDWVGTSMGGLIGMLAAAEDPRIERLVLNDIGPYCDASALAPIATYLGLDLSFADLDDVEKHLRLIHAGFGPLTDAQWRHLATHSSVQSSDGRLRLHYDPDIKAPFLADAVSAIDLWDVWAKIQSPVLCLRGAESVILTSQTAQRMTGAGGPECTLITFDGIGHAPSLMTEDQISAIKNWLEV